MNLELINLVRLQRIDSQILVYSRAEEQGPVKLAEAEADFAAAERKVSESLELEKQLAKKRRELETESEDLENKVKGGQARQLQAKTNDEYRALLREADFLKKSITELDDQLLAAMEQLETLAEENTRLKAWIEEQKQSFEKKKKDIESWIELSRKDKAVLTDKRTEIVRELSTEALGMYDKVLKRRPGRAVVAVIGGICQECNLQIPPQQYNELQRNEKVLVCPHCQRIIYWAEHEDFEKF